MRTGMVEQIEVQMVADDRGRWGGGGEGKV